MLAPLVILVDIRIGIKGVFSWLSEFMGSAWVCIRVRLWNEITRNKTVFIKKRAHRICFVTPKIIIRPKKNIIVQDAV
jgi:hypothetical protein